MRRFLPLVTGVLALAMPGGNLAAREIAYASAPQKLSLTIYRDPDREEGQPLDPDWPEGFAMISETRTVTLAPGQTTIRFDGVAEGMVAISAIVTGLPGGTIEKNRNADLLSPAALVDGTLGNQITITRTNPATGQPQSERAIIRTRADGGLVLQTDAGFEAVRCAGLAETISFDGVPDGLSARPVFSIDTHDATGGTYRVTLTYLASGFDWQAHYVASLAGGGRAERRDMGLMAWLTLVNNNNQSFSDAQLMVVAGQLNITSDFAALSDPPVGRPLALSCYPLGSTAAGSPLHVAGMMGLAAPSPAFEDSDQMIVVTGRRMEMESAASNAPKVAMQAQEEALGDLKLYRLPETVTVAARSQKQVAFINRDGVRGDFLYRARCDPFGFAQTQNGVPLDMLLSTVNDENHGLGMALPSGSMTIFEPSSAGDLLVAEPAMRDYAAGQDIELPVGTSTNVFGTCALIRGRGALEQGPQDGKRQWAEMEARLTNALDASVQVRLVLGRPGQLEMRKTPRKMRVKDGELVAELTLPANAERTITWQVRPAR